MPDILYAQHTGKTFYNPVDIGFGSGYSFQLSDTKNSKGYGAYLSLRSDFRHQPFNFVKVDAGLDIQFCKNRAYDHRPNPDLTFNNVSLDQLSLDFELGFHSPGFREKTGISFRGFIGMGLFVGITSTNLLDVYRRAYDYSSINTDLSRRSIKQSILILTDETFETVGDRAGAALPSAGFQLSYKFTPGFSISFTHKMHFSLTESTGTLGFNMDYNEIPGSFLDITNLTSLGVVFTFREKMSKRKVEEENEISLIEVFDRREKNETVDSVHSNIPSFDREYLLKNNEFTGIVDIPKEDVVVIDVDIIPRIVIQGSDTVNFMAGDMYALIHAKIEGLEDKESISVRMNDEMLPFDYNPSSGSLKVFAYTYRDTCRLQISCWNKAGNALVDRVFYFQKLPQDRIPLVSITQPLTSPYCVSESSCIIHAEVFNINSATDITVTNNGQPYDRFDYSFRERRLRIRIPLKVGQNKIEVKAVNELGTASDRRIIVRESDRCLFPESEMP